MILIKTNKDIGRCIGISRIDNRPIVEINVRDLYKLNIEDFDLIVGFGDSNQEEYKFAEIIIANKKHGNT